jgi:hypothetical protein
VNGERVRLELEGAGPGAAPSLPSLQSGEDYMMPAHLKERFAAFLRAEGQPAQACQSLRTGGDARF